MWRTALLAAAAIIVAGAAATARVRLAPAFPSPAAPSVIPQRIVSLVPAFTEICVRLGLSDRLVGRSRYCDYPQSIQSVPDVGGLLDPNLERIAALRPDLLLLPASGKDLRSLVDGVGLPYLVLPNDSLDDVFDAIRTIGERCGRQAEATALNDELHARMAAAQHRAAGAKPLRVLLSVSASRIPMSPPWTAGPETYLGRLIELAGHRAVPAELDAQYGAIAFETILATDPDVIIECRGLAGDPSSPATDPLQAWATLGDLAAVRAKRVFVLHGPQHVIPGPRFVDTLDELVKLLTP